MSENRVGFYKDQILDFHLLKDPSMSVIGPGRVYFTGTGLADWALRYSL